MIDDERIITMAIQDDARGTHGRGIYWYGAQNGRLLFRDVKNVAVNNFYTVVAAFLRATINVTAAVINISGGSPTSNEGIYLTTTNSAGNSATLKVQANDIEVGAQPVTITINAGTDTTTPTVVTANGLAAAISGANVTVLSITANVAGYIAIVATFSAGLLGGGTTTAVGELGLNIFSPFPFNSMLSRIAVADNANLGAGAGVAVTIQNTYAATFTAVIYL
jgi:hypothetical protein